MRRRSLQPPFATVAVRIHAKGLIGPNGPLPLVVCWAFAAGYAALAAIELLARPAHAAGERDPAFYRLVAGICYALSSAGMAAVGVLRSRRA